MMLRGVVALLLFLGWAEAGISQNLNTQELARQCSEATGRTGNPTAIEEREGFFCLGTILGAWAVMHQNCRDRDMGLRPNWALTAGSMPSLGAGAQAFLNYVDGNPRAWGDPAMVSVMNALADAFPCGR